jgi:signal transduction histidine kinase
MQRIHDVGGIEAGPVDQTPHDYAPWEKKVDALMRLLINAEVFTLDEMRRTIEELGPGAYEQLSYYERWIQAAANLLLEKGVATPSELGRAMEAARARHAEAARCP